MTVLLCSWSAWRLFNTFTFQQSAKCIGVEPKIFSSKNSKVQVWVHCIFICTEQG